MSKYPSAFRVFDKAANELLGEHPNLELLLEYNAYPFAHEAGVFIPESNTLFVTSNQYLHPETNNKHIQISRITLPPSIHSIETSSTEITTDNVPLANGGVNYKDGILFCAQGSLSTPGGLAYMPLPKNHTSSTSYASELLITSFHGRPFNSPNDIVIHSDGSIWFTDPVYGSEQGIRPPPQLPNQVYRFDPATGGIRAVADGFGRPNGICFSPDEQTCYVTDTDWIHGDGTTDGTRASHIYAFDVKMYSGQPFLINRRLFAMADTGIPDGIKCDTNANVYSGCGDGISIWSPGGVLLAKILVDGGVANFCFGKDGQLFLLNENKLWRAQIAPGCKGALLGI
ncbi:gluconolactonase precursor [Boeremia exigua]|uniref:gluconolactonase precursor n=1 Tax=Boeremia exigua TaxID=749465 RepID=UPI001E8DC0C5|nr:gluconolactonase precursor [Boeremia exigua]KAH6621927.1 gluconolactonase precursor [Boeremia exigua]